MLRNSVDILKFMIVTYHIHIWLVDTNTIIVVIKLLPIGMKREVTNLFVKIFKNL